MVNVFTVVRLLSNGAALTTLNLDNTGTGVAAGLAKAIKASSSLTYLNLASNELYPAEARALARALGSSVLKRLNLSTNQICGVDVCGSGTYTSVGIKALAEVLKVSFSLKSLDLNGNGNSIRDEGAPWLSHKLFDVMTSWSRSVWAGMALDLPGQLRWPSTFVVISCPRHLCYRYCIIE